MNGSVKLPEAPTRGLLSYVEGVLFRHRRLVLASLAVFTLIMGWFAVQLRMDAGFESIAGRPRIHRDIRGLPQ